MGKKSKKTKQNEKRIANIMSYLDESCEESNNGITVSFITNLYDTANRVRTIAPTSQRFNEISETLDSLLVQVLDLSIDEVAVLSKIW